MARERKKKGHSLVISVGGPNRKKLYPCLASSFFRHASWTRSLLMVSATRCNKRDIIVCRCRACPNSNADLLSINGDDDGRLRIPPLS